MADTNPNPKPPTTLATVTSVKTRSRRHTTPECVAIRRIGYVLDELSEDMETLMAQAMIYGMRRLRQPQRARVVSAIVALYATVSST